MTKKHFEAAAKYIREYRYYGPGERDAVVATFVAVFREFNPRFDADRFRAACRGENATDSAGRVVRYAAAGETDLTPVGTCPACGETVFANEPDGPVWTCPADLSDKNPFHEPPLHDWTEEERKTMGYYGNCLEDVDMMDAPRHGGTCYDRLPLHSACYERGNY